MAGLPEGPLELLAAAVTPVVMISATAILVSGVNARYISISERIRTLAREHRDSGTTITRSLIIQREMKIFQDRIWLILWAVRALYLAVSCFVTIALLISITAWRQMIVAATLPLFLLGLLLVITAMTLQLLELSESNRTIQLEIDDVVLKQAGEPKSH